MATLDFGSGHPAEARSAGRRAISALAGPLLIAAVVVAILHDFVWRDLLSSQHPDVLAYWLPNYCFLGKSLAAGHIPAWNPYAMGGVPFAADPQSGWMYLPPMLLFSVLPCDLAMRAMIVLQPVLAGLGLHWFCRSEGLSRPSSTVAGLSVSAGVSASRVILFLPFPASFAWTAVTLAAASRLVHARTRASGLGWAVLTAAAWGQLAAAHFAHGLLIGSGAVLAYLIAVSVARVRSGNGEARRAVSGAALVLVAVPFVNLAYLLPRLAYLPRTSYRPSSSSTLDAGLLLPANWVVKLAISPGAYLGAATLALSFAAWRARQHRPLVVAFSVYGALSYAVSLALIGGPLRSLAEHVPALRFYAHFPGRFGLGLLIAIPVLGALGLEAWLSATGARERAIRIAPGLVVWFGLAPLFGASAASLILPAAGLAAMLALLIAAAAVGAGRRRAVLVVALPALLAVELTVNGLLAASEAPAARSAATRPFGAQASGWFQALTPPTIDAREYLKSTPIALFIQQTGAVYLSYDPAHATSRGYLTSLGPRYWGLLANQRGILFHLHDAQGYGPVQVERYWRFVRAATGRPMDYNAAFFPDPSNRELDLLGVRYIVAPSPGEPPALSRSRLVLQQGHWGLWERTAVFGRVQFMGSWRLADGEGSAVSEILDPSVDWRSTVVLETDPGLGPPPPPQDSATPAGGGDAALASNTTQSIVVSVDARRAGLVLVRHTYDPNWLATVDGRRAPVLPADGFLQAVPVHAGRHTVRLTYDDPMIGYGLLGSGISIGLLAALAIAARRRGRAGERRGGTGSAEPGLDDDLGEAEPVLE